MKSAHNRKEMAGKRFGKLLVIEPCEREYKSGDPEYKKKELKWLCHCDCGNSVKVLGIQLRKNRTNSCGCLRKVRSNWTGEGEISGSYWLSIKSHAATRKRKINITLKYIWDLFVAQGKKCALTGDVLKFVSDYRKDKRDQTASLDRIDNAKGYVKGNVRWIHKDVNRLRGVLSDDELFELCESIIAHRRRCGFASSGKGRSRTRSCSTEAR